MTLRTPAVQERCAVAVPFGKVMAQEKLSSVSKSPSDVDIFAVMAVGKRAEPVEREVERVAPVVHGDAAAGVAVLAPPVAPPLVDALRVGVAERLERDEAAPGR